jgi:hypothetical protein
MQDTRLAKTSQELVKLGLSSSGAARGGLNSGIFRSWSAAAKAFGAANAVQQRSSLFDLVRGSLATW